MNEFLDKPINNKPVNNQPINNKPISNKPKKKELITAIAILLAGIAVIIGFSIYSSVNAAKVKSYTHIMATVINYKITDSYSDGIHTDLYSEIVQYEVDGITYTATNPVSASTGYKRIGESIEIAYNPDNPDECIFITFSNKLGEIIALTLGAIFIIIGTVLIIKYIKKSRVQQQPA